MPLPKATATQRARLRETRKVRHQRLLPGGKVLIDHPTGRPAASMAAIERLQKKNAGPKNFNDAMLVCGLDFDKAKEKFPDLYRAWGEQFAELTRQAVNVS